MMFYALVAICLSGSALAQVPGRGDCPHVSVQPNFNVARYMGKWFEQARFFSMFELNGTCVFINFTAGEHHTLHGRLSLISGITGGPQRFERTFTPPTPRVPGRWLIHMPSGAPGLTELMVLGTDYTNYAVLYGCRQFGQLNLKYVWIMTRQQFPSPVVMNRAYAVTTRNKIDSSSFWQTEHHDCPWD